MISCLCNDLSELHKPIQVNIEDWRKCIKNENKSQKIRAFDHNLFTFLFFTATPQIQKLMTVMIRRHETLFPLSKDVLPPSPSNKAESQKNAPRSFVGWESAEVRAFSRTLGFCNELVSVSKWIYKIFKLAFSQEFIYVTNNRASLLTKVATEQWQLPGDWLMLGNTWHVTSIW